ncbi:MAG: co-chaperone GroES [bacterium]
MKITPLGDRILVKRLEAEEKTKGGIILPETAKEKPQEGKVEAVGTGKINEDGKVIPLSLKKGDRIIFTSYAGTEVKSAGEEYLLMREDDVLAKVE